MKLNDLNDLSRVLTEYVFYETFDERRSGTESIFMGFVRKLINKHERTNVRQKLDQGWHAEEYSAASPF